MGIRVRTTTACRDAARHHTLRFPDEKPEHRESVFGRCDGACVSRVKERLREGGRLIALGAVVFCFHGCHKADDRKRAHDEQQGQGGDHRGQHVVKPVLFTTFA